MHDLGLLNQPQQAAVTHGSGPLLVFAGAGSGKTRVITQRVAHLVSEAQVPAWRVLAVTFTNKAAAEMRQRLAALLGASVQQLWVGTFHATCARLLRRHHERCGVLRDFVIYDDADQRALITRLLRELGLDERQLAPKFVASRINWAKQEGRAPEDVGAWGPSAETLKQLYVSYEERMARAGALDFGDLIYRVVRSMRSDPDFLATLRSRYDHVLVDEFQDANRVQFELVRELCAEHRNLCVVGDDDQSIYRWRGADRRNILDFRKTFPDATVVKLEQNYRSTRRILRVAHAVISRNCDREPKRLWTENELGLAIKLCCCWDERAEAEFVLRTVGELTSRGHRLSDMALLYRTHAQSRAFEEKLRAANVDYRVVGGTRFYERAEVKDVLAYLRLLQNPQDDISLLRVINTPPRGIGQTTLERLQGEAAQAKRSLWEQVELSARDSGFGKAVRSRLRAFADLMRQMSDESRDQGPAAAVELVLQRTGYLPWLEAQDRAEADARIENLRELAGSIQDFEDSAGDAELGLTDYLELVSLETDVERKAASDCLSLMTVHAAKGLEFPVVFVAGLEERLFPNRGVGAADDPEDLEEERRLAYVAFTRARQRLILSHAVQRRIYGDLRDNVRSRFLSEIPEADLEQSGIGPSSARSRFGAEPRHKSSFAPAGERPRQGPTVSGDSYVDRSEGFDAPAGDLGFRPGMRVRHKRFGVGQVRAISPETPPKITVSFPGMRPKRIVASFLTPA